MAEEPFVNHLQNEKSPYLLQHLHDPVDWYPWGEEAFQLARSKDKPIFLSIGYATCHWCHVMERESFENSELATMLNENFVNIKVDREELPEIDSLYMEFAQALMSSAGGWPLNVVLTPDLKPLFAVTYLPPKTKRGLIGLDQFILHIKNLWMSEEREQLVAQANKLIEIFQRSTHVTGDELPSSQIISIAMERCFELADPVFGGIKGEPKFPLGYQSLFFLTFAKEKKESRALFYVELTLDRMARGGIYDQLGGGFSRYSVDERWIIPHFEKMLYDNALLARGYLEAWKYTKKESYQQVCKETLNYVLRVMVDPEGGFYSAEDADSEGHEGRFYTWTPGEIIEVLGPEKGQLFCDFYNVSREGNFEGRNVLHIAADLQEFAEMREENPLDILRELEASRKLLLEKRMTRPPPFKDDKILSGVNGLMIDVLIKAARAFDEPRFFEAAIKAAEFLQSHLWHEGKLKRRYRDKEARYDAALDEYAYVIKALLSLFEEGCGTKWLKWALEMTEILEKEFKAAGGAFYQTTEDHSLLIRKCIFYDGAEPSGNAVHAENLLRLFQLTGDEKYLTQAEEIFKAAKNFIETYSPGASYHLIALQRYFDKKATTVVIALDEKESHAKELQKLFATHFSPHLELIWKKSEDALLNELLPNIRDKGPIDGQTAVYICRQDLCEPPLVSVEDISKAVEGF